MKRPNIEDYKLSDGGYSQKYITDLEEYITYLEQCCNDFEYEIDDLNFSMECLNDSLKDLKETLTAYINSKRDWIRKGVNYGNKVKRY